MNAESELPRGDLVLRTVAVPADTNPTGDIAGGWVLSQMDIAGGLAARIRARSRVVTVSIEAMRFHQPVFDYNHRQVICHHHLPKQHYRADDDLLRRRHH